MYIKIIFLYSKKEKMKMLVTKIGDRMYKKHIVANDKNIVAEIQCIEEHEKEIEEL